MGAAVKVGTGQGESSSAKPQGKFPRKIPKEYLPLLGEA